MEYRLTDLGHELGAIVDVLRQWAYTNITRIETARATYDDRIQQE